jgi:predicted permease
LGISDSFRQDLRYTIRTLRRDRVFTTVAVLILALGIGANVAVFSVVNTILLRPLPFPNPEKLVWIAPPPTKCGFSCETYSADAYEELRAQNHSFEDVAGYFAFSSSDNYRLTGRGEPIPATGIIVTGNFFHVLGVQPALGRLFVEDETRKNAHPVVLLANAFWKRRFHSDPKIVGADIDLDGQPTTVVGVLPDSFDFGAVFAPGTKVDVFAPDILDDMRMWGNILTLVGRVKPEVSFAQAQADLQTVAPQLYFNTKYPQSKGRYQLIPTLLKNHVSGKLRRSLIMLWSAVGVILLIVCVNLSNLLLARAVSRGKEMAVRSALGAGRARLIAQLLTESLVLSVAGAIVGLVLAWSITAVLAHQGSIALPLLGSARIDGAALAWTLFIAISVAIVFGVVPGLKMAQGNLLESLKDGGQRTSDSRTHERTRAVLVISEIALACVLLVSAGLLLRSFLRVLDVDLGFEPTRAAAIKVDYDENATGEQRSVIFQQIQRRVESIPGIEAAGFVDYLPLGQNRAWGSPQVKGKTYRPGELPGALVYIVTPGYLRAMGMRVHGRDFNWDDTSKTEKVIIINETVARALWPGEDPVGRVAVANGSDRRIIGVIADVHASNVEGAAGWQVYYPFTQESPNGARLVVRSKLPPATMATAVLSALRELNPNQPASEFQPIQHIVDRAVSPRRFFMLLVLSFAGLGLTLAALGIYGVISYSVNRRTLEIGIRMALGATHTRVQLDVIRRTLWLALIGIGLGTIASIAVARGIASLLFGTQPTDPLTFTGMVLLLSAIALLAGYLPARRASRIQPMSALRSN